MQKTMIKSILTVAVAGAFATMANAAPTAYAPLDPNIDMSTFKLIEMNVDNNIKNLDAGVRANKTAIDNLVNGKVDMGTYLNRVSAVNGEIEKLKLADTALQGEIDTNKADIATNKTDIATNKADIATNKADIATNKADIAANHTLIERYKASSDAQFKAVNSRIDSLDDKMKKGFASQAALNGLFQPYNVGKFNMSVAIGGYDSEQAMAFGSGYRFNENFAIKAGIASDLSGFDHVTYNIGANFEF